MAESIRVRTWATPLTIGAFMLMAVTGVMMFFEWDRSITTVVHQCTGPQMKRTIEQALVDAPISSLANVTRTCEDDPLRRLNERGVAATGAQSIQQVSAESGVSENQLLGIVFLTKPTNARP